MKKLIKVISLDPTLRVFLELVEDTTEGIYLRSPCSFVSLDAIIIATRFTDGINKIPTTNAVLCLHMLGVHSLAENLNRMHWKSP